MSRFQERFRTSGRGSSATGGAGAPSLTVRGLSKLFGGKRAVDGIDLHVEPGTFTVLLGPSGSGKSTLLRCVAGIETPTSGTIALGSQMVDGAGTHLPPERRNLAMVFQDYALWPHMSAEQNVAFALQRCRLDPQQRRDRARTMLDQVGLGGLHHRFPGELSGGEQQRVALARALVADPGLLLFDEPLSNLDADRRERLRVDIGAMVRRHGATALYITHDQAEAFALADMVGVLDQGKLVQLATPEEVYQQPASAFVARFTGLAGELPGTVVSCDEQGVTVGDVGGFVSGRVVGGRVAVGQPVHVLVRPSAVRLVDDEAPVPDPSAPGPSGPGAGPSIVGSRGAHRGAGCTSVLHGVVCDAAFRGWGYEHVVEVAGGHRLTGVPSHRRLPVHHRVQILLEQAGCLVVDDSSRTGRGTRDGTTASTPATPAHHLLGDEPAGELRPTRIPA